MLRLTAGFAAVLLAAPAVSAADAPFPQTAFINEQIAAKWAEAEIRKPAARCSDHEFLRRAFIDLIGRIATPEEVIDFEQDSGKDKRARLINRLLYADKYQPKVGGSRVPLPGGKKGEYLTFDYAYEYSEHWANLWTVWLMSRTGVPGYREQMKVWLTTAFRENKSYKDMVTELLTATGKTNPNGAVNFIMLQLGEGLPPAGGDPDRDRGRFDAVPITSRVTRLFLGLQTQCTQCHDHSFNKEWVQGDFWGVNAFFRQVNMKGTPTRPPTPGQRMADSLAVVELYDDSNLNPSGRVFYERRDGKLMATKPLFLKDVAEAEKGRGSGKTMPPEGGRTRRQVLAEYVTSHDNFAKAFVSRTWGHLFGRGLHKEPAFDDFGNFSGENPVVHPELLDRLAKDFAQYKYDQKMMLEWVCNSDAYQLSHVGTKEYTDQKYDPYFARMPLKALSPEVLFESLMVATKAEASANSDKRKELRERWMSRLVQQFGDDEGNEGTFNGTVVQALLMMNGRELNDEIGDKGANAVQRVVQKHSRSGTTNADAVLDDLFLMTLNRRPAPDERVKIKTVMQRGALVKLDAPKPAEPPAKGPKGKGPKAAYAPPATPGVVMPTHVGDVTFYQDVFWALLNTNEFMLNH
jgi:hypothetical protein